MRRHLSLLLVGALATAALVLGNCSKDSGTTTGSDSPESFSAAGDSMPTYGAEDASAATRRALTEDGIGRPSLSSSCCAARELFLEGHRLRRHRAKVQFCVVKHLKNAGLVAFPTTVDTHNYYTFKRKTADTTNRGIRLSLLTGATGFERKRAAFVLPGSNKGPMLTIDTATTDNTDGTTDRTLTIDDQHSADSGTLLRLVVNTKFKKAEATTSYTFKNSEFKKTTGGGKKGRLTIKTDHGITALAGYNTLDGFRDIGGTNIKKIFGVFNSTSSCVKRQTGASTTVTHTCSKSTGECLATFTCPTEVDTQYASVVTTFTDVLTGNEWDGTVPTGQTATSVNAGALHTAFEACKEDGLEGDDIVTDLPSCDTGSYTACP